MKMLRGRVSVTRWSTALLWFVGWLVGDFGRILMCLVGGGCCYEERNDIYLPLYALKSLVVVVAVVSPVYICIYCHLVLIVMLLSCIIK